MQNNATQEVNTTPAARGRITEGTYMSYGFGGFGHDVLYAVMSTYLMTFLTTQLFSKENAGWTVVITTLIMVLRIVEIVVDPMIGGVVDRTKSKIGKFKPWILGGGLVWTATLIVLFTNFGGMPTDNPLLYIIIFCVLYVIMDFAFSFKDTAYWGMVSAIAIDSESRNKLGTIARMGSVIGQATVMIAAVPMVKFFSGGKDTHITAESVGNTTGWFLFALIMSLIAFITCIIVAVGTRESDVAIRAEGSEHVTVTGVFKTMAKNDQLMWIAASYIFFCLAQLTTQSMLLPYFMYVVGNPDFMSGVGIINLVVSFLAVSAFPVLSKYIGRKKLLLACIALMIFGTALFFFADTNVVFAFVGYFFFQAPYPILFLCVMLTIADTVEYGQWKNGVRAEATTLVARVMCDKVGGAVANGVMGLLAVLCAINADATYESVHSNPHNILNFKILMVVVPAILMVISFVIYSAKVKINEKWHADIVKELETKASAQPSI